jgi:hypothetical protein
MSDPIELAAELTLRPLPQTEPARTEELVARTAIVSGLLAASQDPTRIHSITVQVERNRRLESQLAAALEENAQLHSVIKELYSKVDLAFRAALSQQPTATEGGE